MCISSWQPRPLSFCIFQRLKVFGDFRRGTASEADATFDMRLGTALCLLWATWQPGRRRGTSWLAPAVVHLVSLIGTERWREGPPSCLLWARLGHVTAWSQAEVGLPKGYQRCSSSSSRFRNSIRQPVTEAPTAWTRCRAAVRVKYFCFLFRDWKCPLFFRMKFILSVLQVILVWICASLINLQWNVIDTIYFLCLYVCEVLLWWIDPPSQVKRAHLTYTSGGIEAADALRRSSPAGLCCLLGLLG